MIRFLAAAIAALTVIGGAAAEPVTIGSITIDQAWSRATPKNAKVGAGYLKITNNGAEADRLIGAASEAANKVEIHQMSMKDGVMKMAPVDGGLEIKPGETVHLKPGGFHLMFMGLKAPFEEGRMVMATVTLQKAGTAKVMMPVGAIGAKSMDHSGHSN